MNNRTKTKNVKQKVAPGRASAKNTTTSKFVKITYSMIALHKEATKQINMNATAKEAFIPFLLPSFMKGTQIVELRLPLTAYKITTANATAYNTVLSVTAAVFNNFTDCANLFDEYRIVRGELHYHATYSNTANNVGWGGATVDYSISAAFSSFDAMYSHDTRVIGSFTNYNSKDVGKVRFKWPLKFDPMPDQDWIPTTTSNTVFCYWKPYLLAATINASEDAGHLLGWADFQFRGMAA